MPRFLESDLIIDFPDDVNVVQLEKETEKVHGMQPVDFIFTHGDHTILLEIKNFRQRSDIKKITSETLAKQEIVPKARDSYSYLHLMLRDHNDFFLVFLFDSPLIEYIRPLLPVLNSSINRYLMKEAPEPWKRQYIKRSVIMTPENFTTYFPGISVTRK